MLICRYVDMLIRWYGDLNQESLPRDPESRVPSSGLETFFDDYRLSFWHISCDVDNPKNQAHHRIKAYLPCLKSRNLTSLALKLIQANSTGEVTEVPEAEGNVDCLKM